MAKASIVKGPHRRDAHPTSCLPMTRRRSGKKSEDSGLRQTIGTVSINKNCNGEDGRWAPSPSLSRWPGWVNYPQYPVSPISQVVTGPRQAASGIVGAGPAALQACISAFDLVLWLLTGPDTGLRADEQEGLRSAPGRGAKLGAPDPSVLRW
eukprot:scaffold142193_cov27-Tisochrysis_lutea.AAC.3